MFLFIFASERKINMNKFLYKLLYCIARLLSMLPIKVLFVLSDIVYFVAYYCVGYRREVVKTNLRNSFPDKHEAELKEIERKFYHNLCDYFFETIKLIDMSREKMLRHIEYENAEKIGDLLNEGRNVVLYLSHTFNWEWLVSMRLSFPNVSEKAVFGQIYHPLENEYFDKLFLHIRGIFGQVNIAMRDTLRVLVNYKRENRPFLIGFIADQVPVWESIGGFTEFLRQDTAVFTGAEKIARKFDAVVYYGDMIKVGRGHYKMVLSEITDSCKKYDEFDLTRLYFSRLEKSINDSPASWLWSHRRWKRTREGYAKYVERGNLKKNIDEKGVIR